MHLHTELGKGESSEKKLSMMAGPDGQQGKPVKRSSGSTPGGIPALLGRFCDPGQVTPRSALLSGLLGDVNEKVPSARGQSWPGASAPNVTMMTTTTARNQLDLGLTSISDTKRKASQSKGFLISYISSCLSFMSKGLVITFILCVLRRCGL